MAGGASSASWNRTARALHWSMAALIGVQGLLGWIGHEMERSPLKIEVMTAHKSLGITLLLLALWRLLWRWAHGAPPPPPADRRWEILAARLSHALLYLLMFAVPVSGWLAASTSIIPWKFWWLLPWPDIAAPDRALHDLVGEIHEVLFKVLLALLAIHVAAALWHQFGRRDGLLLRMWRGRAT